MKKIPTLPLTTTEPLEHMDGHTLVDATGDYAGKTWRYGGKWHAAVTAGLAANGYGSESDALAALQLLIGPEA